MQKYFVSCLRHPQPTDYFLNLSIMHHLTPLLSSICILQKKKPRPGRVSKKLKLKSRGQQVQRAKKSCGPQYLQTRKTGKPSSLEGPQAKLKKLFTGPAKIKIYGCKSCSAGPTKNAYFALKDLYIIVHLHFIRLLL